MAEAIVLRVAADSNPSSVAGSIAKNFQEGKRVELDAVGAGAINQMVKACAIARRFLAPLGRDIAIIPAFTTTLIDGVEKTAIKFIVIER